MMMEFWRRMNFNKLFLLILFLITHLSAQDCKSTLIIISDFELVNIFINDSLVSENGIYQAELEQGIYIIVADEVSDRWNSKTFFDTIEIKNCDKIELNFYFRNYNNQSDAFGNQQSFQSQKKYFMSDSAYNNFALQLPNPEKKEKFIDTHLFKILTGSAILLGGITAYYKIKADKYFDDYLSTRDKEKLDKTKKFDLISGVTLVAFQINFGYILLRFLIE